MATMVRPLLEPPACLGRWLPLAAVLCCPLAQGAHQVESPSGKAAVTISGVGGGLRYAVTWNGSPIISPSAISLLDSGCQVTGTEIIAIDNTWKPVWGECSEVRDNARELRVKLQSGEEVFELQVRAYDDGVAFRFVMPGGMDGANFRCEHRFDPSARYWWTIGEHEPPGPVGLSKDMFGNGARLPLVVDAGGSGHAAVLESDLYSATAFGTMRLRVEGDPLRPLTESKGTDGAKITPWRVILLGDNAGDLRMSTTALNVAAPNQLADTSWIRPGKAMWDWRLHDYRSHDGFTYGINTASYLRLIDFAARNRIDHLLIDDHWFSAAGDGRLRVAADLDIREVMRHARGAGVGVILYYDRRKGDFGDAALFPELAARGAAGVKYGFMGDKPGFTRSAIAAAAKEKLLVNFHDSPTPMTGVERTMPNFVTREYCHAQQDRRSAFTPEAFLKMALVNNLTGPLDMSNGTYGLNDITRRAKGPKNPLNATVVAETARAFIIYSGLVSLPDAPEEYEKKADLFEFIREMPVSSDETRILNAEIGRSITMLRRKGGSWFIASAIDEQGGTLGIPLDFLQDGRVYQATWFEDAPDAHFIHNREAYQVRTGTVKKGDHIQARLAPGGGHCLWIRP
jgi:alpha-glucosidase